jgi:hypothetical protein
MVEIFQSLILNGELIVVDANISDKLVTPDKLGTSEALTSFKEVLRNALSKLDHSTAPH